jgi:hypothetical protein
VQTKKNDGGDKLPPIKKWLFMLKFRLS